MSKLGKCIRSVLGHASLLRARSRTAAKILVVGVYVRDKPTLAPEIAAALTSTRHQVTQAWAGLGTGVNGLEEMRRWTTLNAPEPVPKFTLINRLIATLQLANFSHLIVTDDDIEIPPGFIDDFIGLQDHYGFALAQPARTLESNIDHPVTLESHARMARQTRFVEIGPLFCVASAAFPLIVPFDESFPMGWGLDHVWPIQLEQKGLSMGIIDRRPVHHRFRPLGSTYSSTKTLTAMRESLKGRQTIRKEDFNTPLRTFWF